METKKPNHLREWEKLNAILKAHTIYAIVSGSVSLTALGFAYHLSAKPPLVVAMDGKSKTFLETKRERLKMTKEDIEVFSRDFVRRLHGWDAFDKDRVLREISPLATEGLVKKISESLKEATGSKQSVLNLNVKILGNGVKVSFDTVFRVQGSPFAKEKKLIIQMTRGTITRLNPLGIYVHKIVYLPAGGKGGG